MDQKIKYPIICKSTDKFTKIEELLYKEFPEYRESENIFLVNGQKVDRFQSMDNLDYRFMLYKIKDKQNNDRKNIIINYSRNKFNAYRFMKSAKGFNMRCNT